LPGPGGTGILDAMSQANVDVARRAFDAFNRRDLQAFVAVTDPEVDFTPFAGEWVGSFHGHQGLARWWAELSRVFEVVRYELIEWHDLGDLGLCSVRAHGQSRGGHAPFETTLWMVGEFRDEKLLWWRTCHSHAEALEHAEGGGFSQ
jgi:ketosteroid isomerase-like protein